MTAPDRGGLSVTPAGDDRDGWLRFVAETRALVGEHDPVTLLAGAPERYARSLARFTTAQRDVPERPGAWSATQVLAHVADTETAWSVRIRQILVLDDYVMDGFDQAEWAARLPYATWNAEESLALFAQLRARNLTIWQSLSAAEWERSARHGHRDGRESLRDIARLLAGHDLRHERQLARIRASLG
ncbi:MAG: DinB family protein [Gemmatimonadetes bacterium]|nr:DinB family protein [Gemmatimonadota bacterium]